MPKKRRHPPVRPVRRTLFLKWEEINWALSTMRDDRANYEKRCADEGMKINPEWLARYDRAEEHLIDIRNVIMGR